MDIIKQIESKLSVILEEIRNQPEAGECIPSDLLDFNTQIHQITEWIYEANEYGIAYESIVCLLESYPFKLTGKSAVYLLEIGLLFKFKTERDEDNMYNNRFT